MSITKVTDAGLDKSRIVTPLIINGDMSVAQRSTSSTSTGIQTCDRWNVRTLNTDNLAITQAQSTTVPGQGFKFSYKYDTTTAESALASNETLAIETRLEANTLQGLKYGTAQAEATTLGFWCKGSLTGVHGIYIRTHDGAQEFVQSYNIDTADTWEFKTINIPANTAKVINNDNGIGWWIQWGLAAGSDYDGATLGSWHDNATEIFPTNQVNYMANTSYEFLLTGVQLEIGTFDNNTMPAFPFESFESNLRKCQRYYFCSDTVTSGTEFFPCFCPASGNKGDSIKFTAPVPLRSPDNTTLTVSAGTSQLVGGGYSSSTTVPSFTRRNNSNDVDGTTKPSGDGTKIYFVSSAIFSSISEGFAGFGTTGTIQFDNEL